MHCAHEWVTILFGRNGTKYSESEIKNDNFTVKLSFLFNSENSVILRYTRNIVQLSSFYIKFDSKHVLSI
jgi:hypothetical protein